ncbi:MAG: undecaprenyl-diphosphate phosphatase [Bacteroidales bacterium]|nr:undecaprenyl-diphosphate phosphatase [Bacteroidales bacterium]
MDWLQALFLGLVQGLTEFLPVSSSGHLLIARELLGVDAEGFLDFTVTVHMATVLSTIVVFWKPILRLLSGFFKFKYNDETDYVLKILVSMIPVSLVGLLLKDKVEALFGDSLTTVAVFLAVTAALLFFSDMFGKPVVRPVPEPVDGSTSSPTGGPRNGIKFWQALLVGAGQALAVAPGLSRSGTTISVGLCAGVRRDVMAQFSFLMVLIPIIGEQALDVLKAVTGHAAMGGGISPVCLAVGFIAAFAAGLLACKAMVALVRRARLSWFALYCLAVAVLIFIFA